MTPGAMPHGAAARGVGSVALISAESQFSSSSEKPCRFMYKILPKHFRSMENFYSASPLYEHGL